jgi:streptogramin lyase
MKSPPGGPWPWSIVRIYVTDLGNHRIVRMNTLDGVGWVALGSFGDGINQFAGPWSIFVEPKTFPPALATKGDSPAGLIYVTDSYNHRLVRMNNMTGAGWTTLGTQGNGSKQFNGPTGLYVAWDHPAIPPKRRIYVADRMNHRIVRFDDMTGAGWTTLGTQGNGVKQFDEPFGVHVDHKGRIYVADWGNDRLVRMNDMTGAGWTTLGTTGTGDKQFGDIDKVVVDGEDRIYVADGALGNDRFVRVYDMTGAGWSTFGSHGQGVNQFSGAAGIHVAFPRIYMTDANNYRIARIDYFGGPGWKTLGTYGSGINQFDMPWDIFVG